MANLDASVVPASRTPSSGNNNQLGLTLSINGLTLLLLVLFAVYRWPTEALTTLASKKKMSDAASAKFKMCHYQGAAIKNKETTVKNCPDLDEGWDLSQNSKS